MAEFVLTPQIKAMALKSMRELRGEHVFIVNAETSKPVRVAGNGQVTGNGGLGGNARFKVMRGDRPHRLGPVVRFKNQATGHFLAIKNGQVTVGTGGEHCEFIVQQDHLAVFLKKHNNPNVRMGFNANGSVVPANALGDGARGRFFMFDTDSVVGGGGGGGAQARQQEAIRQQQLAQQQAMHQQQQAQASFVLTPQIKAMALRSMRELRGESVFIVNAETSKPIMVGPGGNVTANGNLGPNSRFKVKRGDHPHELGPVIRFKNHASGQFLAIKNGNLTIGGGGEHCEFIVQMAQQAVFLKKHNNPNARIGFNANGSPVAANALGDGSRGRFFIFDCDQVVPTGHHQPIPQAHHPHPHPVPQPQLHPQPVRPGQKCLLKISDTQAFAVVGGGANEGHALLLRQGADVPSRRHAHFVFKPTAFPNTFIVKAAHADLFLHAHGGSNDGAKLILHGNEGYARQHPNSKFQVVPTRGHHTFILKVHNSDLGVHAFGGSHDGAELKLHGGVGYNQTRPNGQFQFVPI